MDDFRKKRILGKTGFTVCRLGAAGGYGAPAKAFEEAFEKGVNYFYIGSGIHEDGMRKAIRNIVKKGQRDKLVVAVQTYARLGVFSESNLRKALKGLSVESADILVLGWHNKAPSQTLMERAQKLKEKGLVRFLGMSGHTRTLFPEMDKIGIFDMFQIRYNAAHRGAEVESFPQLSGKNRPGIVTYTATRWGHLLSPKKMPPGSDTPPASDCYRFVLTNEKVDVCLCGPKNINQMREALKTMDLGPMDEEGMTRMRKIGDYVHKKTKGFFNWI